MEQNYKRSFTLALRLPGRESIDWRTGHIFIIVFDPQKVSSFIPSIKNNSFEKKKNLCETLT